MAELIAVIRSSKKEIIVAAIGGSSEAASGSALLKHPGNSESHEVTPCDALIAGRPSTRGTDND